MKAPSGLIVRMTFGERDMVGALADTFGLSQSAVVRLALRRLYRQMAENGLPPIDIMQDLAVQALKPPHKGQKGGRK